MSRNATHPGWRRSDPVAIPGSYQYDALVAGPAPQRFWHRRKLELVRSLTPPRAGMRALDVGCGSGVVAAFLADQGAEVDAVDTNEDALRFARSQFEGGNLRFHLTAANEMAFADGSFDLIVCLEVIEHLPAAQVAALFGLLGRLLAAQGVLLVTTPNGASLWPLIERAMDLFGLSPPMHGEQHITRFTRGRLEHALKAAGLEVLRSGRFCGLAPFVAGLSWRLAARLDTLECRVGQPLGNLLYALAGRTPPR
mgnify:CR=1 FL=1